MPTNESDCVSRDRKKEGGPSGLSSKYFAKRASRSP
jgi:hypothetical protein